LGFRWMMFAPKIRRLEGFDSAGILPCKALTCPYNRAT
jgi:hypothetical protein